MWAPMRDAAGPKAATALATQAQDGGRFISFSILFEGGSERRRVRLQRGLVSQRALQAALPAHDDHEEWRRCWALLKQHESTDLDTVELEEAQQKQADIRSFQLEMQRRKRLEARERTSVGCTGLRLGI